MNLFRCAPMRVLFLAGLVVGSYGGIAPVATAGVAGIAGWVGPAEAQVLNPELKTWASGVVDYSPAPGTIPSTSNAAKALGPITSSSFGETVSLGDLDAGQITAGALPGSITLSFENTFHNGDGWDLAVFENAFSFFAPDDDKVFAELAYVEVSTDGQNFARFPSLSLTTEETIHLPDFGNGPLRDFAGIKPADVHNLAGYHGSLIGTPFDLDDIIGINPLVDANNINFVRLVDIPGGGQFFDSQTVPNPILDAWTTTSLEYGNGGLDLDAVAARYAVPEPSSLLLLVIGLAGLSLRRRRSC